ncbi:MAG: phage integrase N-terminal SAM-like domain-containing protein [Deltaproteobacteria bacterium]|nr:phage integrase N-terminal SAM-like domain-containing protein [Deltaproteobacteria bacterium]
MKHYAYRTDCTYSGWIKRFILFHDQKYPGEMGEPEVGAFLIWLAVAKKVSKSTQNQAFNALIFLYREVLKCPLKGRIDAVRSFKKQRLIVSVRPETRIFVRDQGLRKILPQAYS